MKLVLILLTLFIYSCDKGPTSPEGLLKMYVQDITSKKLDRDYFNKYTTGKLLETITALDDDEFSNYVDLSKIKNPRLKISNKNCAGNECVLTYFVKYDVNKGDNKQFESEIKKIATLVKEGESWKISEVTNVKTYHEAVTPINALEN